MFHRCQLQDGRLNVHIAAGDTAKGLALRLAGMASYIVTRPSSFVWWTHEKGQTREMKEWVKSRTFWVSICICLENSATLGLN
jgi:hypothetical protein